MQGQYMQSHSHLQAISGALNNLVCMSMGWRTRRELMENIQPPPRKEIEHTTLLQRGDGAMNSCTVSFRKLKKSTERNQINPQNSHFSKGHLA